MTTEKQFIHPKIGEGVYLVRDIAKILRLDYEHVRRWIAGYWSGSLNQDIDYTFGEKGSKAVNFYSLIEFYTFFKLREAGLSTSEIRKLHNELSEKHHTPYPFATAREYYIEKRKKKNFVYYEHLGNLLKRGNDQPFFKFLDKFLDKVEFDESNLAARFFPLNNSRNIVVDPKHQFGQPTITGTNIKTQTIFNLYKGGEPIGNICNLYNLSSERVQDAIAFHKNAA